MHCRSWIFLLVAIPTVACGIENVVIQRDSESQKRFLSGRIITEARDGGILLQTRDGFVWAIQPTEILERSTDDATFSPYSRKEIEEVLREEFPDDFRIHVTAHYVVCYNTSQAYAEWCGAVYEQLYRAFQNYWRRRGLDLHDPEFPLVAVVFRDQTSFQDYSEGELGDAVQSIIGYYSLTTNRVTMYDLTGIEAFRARYKRELTARELNFALAAPEMERTVATVVHEATHQIAFNCGVHERFADIPLWLSEGIAMYFETPDLRSSRGWRNIGGVNYVRLHEFRQGMSKRPEEALQALLQDDQRFARTDEMAQAYPESWALVFYLIRKKPKPFVEYLRTVSQIKALIEDSPVKRLDDFRAAFGHDLERLDRDMLRSLSRLR